MHDFVTRFFEAVSRRISATCVAASVITLPACYPSEHHIQVRVSYPGEAAVANLEITALPFDRDALRDSLARTTRLPRPDFTDLAAEVAEYRKPDLSILEQSSLPWQTVYDSVERLSDSLTRVGANSSVSYARAYARLREQYQRLAQSTARLDEAMQEVIGDDRQFASRVAAAADTLRAWEGHAYASYPEIVDSILVVEGREIHHAKTDSDGIAEFTLEPGQWWFVATSRDTDNPFTELYWNVGARFRFFGTAAVPLYEGNGIRRWRY